ncbi:hypothetical protein M0R45_006866 [Rubus argutus]|uniref:Uncharacterized protein n=1 Tax=Rubus argutus TaxID=59490 RepID=A0AAW1YSE7_RUBAR
MSSINLGCFPFPLLLKEILQKNNQPINSKAAPPFHLCPTPQPTVSFTAFNCPELQPSSPSSNSQFKIHPSKPIPTVKNPQPVLFNSTNLQSHKPRNHLYLTIHHHHKPAAPCFHPSLRQCQIQAEQVASSRRHRRLSVLCHSRIKESCLSSSCHRRSSSISPQASPPIDLLTSHVAAAAR